jgi:hypothetical protein
MSRVFRFSPAQDAVPIPSHRVLLSQLGEKLCSSVARQQSVIQHTLGTLKAWEGLGPDVALLVSKCLVNPREVCNEIVCEYERSSCMNLMKRVPKLALSVLHEVRSTTRYDHLTVCTECGRIRSLCGRLGDSQGE